MQAEAIVVGLDVGEQSPRDSGEVLGVWSWKSAALIVPSVASATASSQPLPLRLMRTTAFLSRSRLL